MQSRYMIEAHTLCRTIKLLVFFCGLFHFSLSGIAGDFPLTLIQSKDFQTKNITQEGKRKKIKTERDAVELEKASRKSNSLLEEKRQRALFIAESALVNAESVSSIEYRILIKLEAASLLWHFDQSRTNTIFEAVIKEVKDLSVEGRKKSGDQQAVRVTRKLWQAVLNKIAAVNPALLKGLAGESSTCSTCSLDKNIPSQGTTNWTAEAKSLMGVASDQIENSPQLASQIAEQSLSFGLVDWSLFLIDLSKRDNAQSERLGAAVLTQLRSTAIAPTYFLNQKRFFLASTCSPQLQEQFLETVLFRLKQKLNATVSLTDLQAGLNVSRQMAFSSENVSPQWKQLFESLASEFDLQYRNASLSMPALPATKMIDTSSMEGAKLGDTQSISEKLSQASNIVDKQERDNEYRKLAGKAALNADLGLAENILSKIKNEEIHRQATLSVYGPFVRKSIAEGDWIKAQNHALLIEEPMGRTLILDRLAQAMHQSGQKAFSVEQVYSRARQALNSEEQNIQVAKATVLLAKSLLRLDTSDSLKMANSIILGLNNQANNEHLYDEPTLASGLSTWTQFRNYYLDVEEIFDLPAMLSTTFQEMARKDEDNASFLASSLKHSGFRILSQLAIGKELWLKASVTKVVVPIKNNNVKLVKQ